MFPHHPASQLTMPKFVQNAGKTQVVHVVVATTITKQTFLFNWPSTNYAFYLQTRIPKTDVSASEKTRTFCTLQNDNTLHIQNHTDGQWPRNPEVRPRFLRLSLQHMRWHQRGGDASMVHSVEAYRLIVWICGCHPH